MGGSLVKDGCYRHTSVELNVGSHCRCTSCHRVRSKKTQKEWLALVLKDVYGCVLAVTVLLAMSRNSFLHIWGFPLDVLSF